MDVRTCIYLCGICAGARESECYKYGKIRTFRRQFVGKIWRYEIKVVPLQRFSESEVCIS